MKSLKTKIYESELNESFYKNAGGVVRPTTKDELINEIKIRLDRGQTNLNDIDTSKITNMSDLFCEDFDGYDLSKLDISLWDVSNVKDMSGLFFQCTNFNSDLSKWNTSKVTDMSTMFYNCEKFNCDLSKWNTSKVDNMSNMFRGCSNFNSDLSKWNVSNVTNMNSMFAGCSNFNSDLSNWNPESDPTTYRMFYKSGVKKKPRW